MEIKNLIIHILIADLCLATNHHRSTLNNTKNDIHTESTTTTVIGETTSINLTESPIQASTITPHEPPPPRTNSDEFIADLDVHFHLYNAQTNCRNVPEIILNNPETIAQSNFNPTLPTRILIHDWDTTSKSEFSIMITEAYLENSNNHNIIIVDWEKKSLASYSQARNSSMQIGQTIGKFVDFLWTNGNLNLTDVYLIGFGLGAHIAGVAGRTIQKTTNQMVAVIFGLDPFQLRTNLFNFADSMLMEQHHDDILQQSDAKYVEVIYTSLLTSVFQEPVGHANFYVNLGGLQPGCDLIMSCGHARAYRYFAESINSKLGFSGRPCQSYRDIILARMCRRTSTKMIGQMGGRFANFKNSGVYDVDVNPIRPHAIFMNQ